MFVRESLKKEQEQMRRDVLSVWTGFNADQKYIKELTGGRKVGSRRGGDKSGSSAAVRAEWMRLAGAMARAK